jgi:hypothetical protein
MATSVSGALPYIGGGVLGAGFTYGLTWVRERRRTVDAYRAPQRQAIGDIVAATHEYMLCELELRTLMGGLVEQVRQDSHIVTAEQADAARKALGRALLGAERALQIARLTIVDAPCWQAMGVAYVELSRLRAAMAARVDAPEMESPEEIEHYVEGIKVLAEQFNRSVLALVVAAADRVSPAETMCSRWRRRDARRAIGEHYQQRRASDPPDQPQQP